jgi:hypothetical protein
MSRKLKKQPEPANWNKLEAALAKTKIAVLTFI